MPRGRKKGSRNLKTLWKEAEKLVGTNSVAQALDPLDVIETIMRYFYSLADARKESGGTIGEVIGYYKEAARLAALAAPYRHGRLSAIKLLGDPNAGLGGFKADATLEELRVELGKRVLAMAHSGLIDIDPAALPQPENRATAAQSVGAK
jgi:hypothetical protein